MNDAFIPATVPIRLLAAGDFIERPDPNREGHSMYGEITDVRPWGPAERSDGKTYVVLRVLWEDAGYPGTWGPVSTDDRAISWSHDPSEKGCARATEVSQIYKAHRQVQEIRERVA